MPTYTGEEAERKIDKELERQKEAKAAFEAGGGNDDISIWRQWWKRWWMPPTPRGEDGKFVTFLDDLVHPAGYKMPFTTAEHQVWDPTKKRMAYYPCIEGDPDPKTGEPMVCEGCKKFKTASIVSAFTVIDHSEWIDSKEKVHKDEQKLLMAKASVFLKLQKQMKRRDGLRGWKVEITRGTEDDANTGDDFDFIEKTELSADIQPPDYKKIFFTPTEQELKDMIAGKEVTREDKKADTGSDRGEEKVGDQKPIDY
jgi:hypothetical protein